MHCCKVVSTVRAMPQHAACAAAARTLLLPWRRQQQQHAKAGTSSTRRRATTTIAKVCVCVRCQASFACPESVGQGDGHTAGAEHRNTERSYAPPRRASFLAKLLPCSSAHSLLSARPPPKRLPAQADHNAAAAAADDGGLDNDVSLRVTFSFLKRGREVFSASGCAGSGGDALSAFNEVLPLVLKRGGALQGGPGPAAPAAAAAAAATEAADTAADDDDVNGDEVGDKDGDDSKPDMPARFPPVPADATHIFADGMLCKVERNGGEAADLRGLGTRAVTLPPFKNAIESLAHLERLGAVCWMTHTHDARRRGGGGGGDAPADFDLVESPVFQDGARKHILIGPHVLPVFKFFEEEDHCQYQHVKIDRATMDEFNAAGDLGLEWPVEGDCNCDGEGEPTMDCEVEHVARLVQRAADPTY